MDTTYNNSYNAMFNIDYSKITINDIDDITIKLNNDNKIYVYKLTDNNFDNKILSITKLRGDNINTLLYTNSNYEI